MAWPSLSISLSEGIGFPPTSILDFCFRFFSFYSLSVKDQTQALASLAQYAEAYTILETVQAYKSWEHHDTAPPASHTPSFSSNLTRLRVHA